MSSATNDNDRLMPIGDLFTESVANRVTYGDLVTRYGTTVAFDLLLSVERMAKIKNDIICLDEEQRFQTALEALNKVDVAGHV